MAKASDQDLASTSKMPALLPSSSIPGSASVSPARNAPSSSSRRNGDKSEKRRSSRACLECRLAKTKCQITSHKDICDRCAKFSFECRFVRHHRGRKPVSKLASLDSDDLNNVSALLGDVSEDDLASEGGLSDSPSESTSKVHPSRAIDENQDVGSSEPLLEKKGDADSNRNSRDLASAKRSSGRSTSRGRATRGSSNLNELDTQARRRIWDMLSQKIPQRGSTYTFVSQGEVAHDTSSSNAPTSTSKEGAADPSASASSSAAISGSSATSVSTFRNLLRPVDKRTSQQIPPDEGSPRCPRLPETLTLFGPKDPVELGLLSLTSAKKLYDYFFLHINPWAMIFDPNLISHDSVRSTSSHLYTAILYLASRYIELNEDEGHDPLFGSVYPGYRDAISTSTSAKLGSHARSLAITAFALGDRRMETGAAMWLSSVWKEADDHFTILYCSYAAKIMSDIPTELLSLLPSSPSSNPSELAQNRLRRQQQRMFLFHFVQEHTQLLHFAPRPNFDRGPSLLRNLLAWSDDPLATEDDVLLCADIDSVLLQTKYKSIMEKAQTQEKDTLYGSSECFLLLQSFLDELDGWRSRWEWQARKINQRFGREADSDKGTEANGHTEAKPKLKTFEGSLPLSARMHLLSIMRNSLLMQISSIAFRASLRDINKAKPSLTTAASKVASEMSKTGSKYDVAPSSASSLATLSAMDDRAEQIYYICLDSALNLLVHTMGLSSSILRHAQDMIMVLAPHAALLATYLISLPLPSVPHMTPSGSSSSTSASTGGENGERISSEFGKIKTRVRRRKEYERKCLELMRDTRECFRQAVVRQDDHVGLCAQYFDSLLNVIEGEASEVGRSSRSAMTSSNSSAGVKRSRSSFDVDRGTNGDNQASRPAPGLRGHLDHLKGESASTRSSSIGPGSGTKTSNLDSVAAETLLNLHSESSQPFGLTTSGSPYPSDPSYNTTSSPNPHLFGSLYAQHQHPHATVHGQVATPPGSGTPPSSAFAGAGMFGNFSASSPHANVLGHPAPTNVGDFVGMQGNQHGGSGTGTSTPVDWTWLQSFLEVPEFSWM